jgi:hypothetical protein
MRFDGPYPDQSAHRRPSHQRPPHAILRPFHGNRSTATSQPQPLRFFTPCAEPLPPGWPKIFRARGINGGIRIRNFLRERTLVQKRMQLI